MTQEQRIDELERQSRRSRRTGTAILVTILGALAVWTVMLATSHAGARDLPKPGVLTDIELRLVDSSGRDPGQAADGERQPGAAVPERGREVPRGSGIAGVRSVPVLRPQQREAGNESWGGPGWPGHGLWR